MDPSRMRMSQVVTESADARGEWRDSGLFCREWRADSVGSGRRCERIRRFTQWMMQERRKVSKARGNASRVGRRRRKVKQNKKGARRIERGKGGNLGMIVVVVNIVDGVCGWMIGIGTGREWDVGVTAGTRKGGSKWQSGREGDGLIRDRVGPRSCQGWVWTRGRAREKGKG